MVQTQKTQRQRLIEILDGRWRTLSEAQAECLSRFGSYDSETALSARFRELPQEMRLKRIRKGTRSYEYSVCKL